MYIHSRGGLNYFIPLQTNAIGEIEYNQLPAKNKIRPPQKWTKSMQNITTDFNIEENLEISDSLFQTISPDSNGFAVGERIK